MGWIKEMNEHCFLCGVKVWAPETEPDPADCFVPLCTTCNDASGDPANYVERPADLSTFPVFPGTLRPGV